MSTATGTYGDWTFVVWALIVCLFWLSVAVLLGTAIGKMFKRRDRRPTHALCACGCGRVLPLDQGWDGYHGADPARVVVPVRTDVA